MVDMKEILTDKFKFVDFSKRERNFKCFCHNLQKQCKGDFHVSGKFNNMLVTVWGDSTLCMIQYYTFENH